MRVHILIGVLLLVCCSQARKRYDGYKVIKVVPTEEHHVGFLREMELTDNQLDFWVNGRLVGKEVYIMAPPSSVLRLMMKLYVEGMTPTIYNNNVQSNLDKEFKRLNSAPRAFNIDDFNRYEDIMTEVDSLAGRCASGVTCKSYVISPKSVEGRDLKVLSMSTAPGTNKTAFWIDATIHAREWLATATHLKILTRFVDNYNTDAEVKRLVDTYDWYFLPVVNPDGYVYTWDNDRFWRKSRNINADEPDCFGTDLNRNFDTGNWCSQGASTDPCSNTYCGSSAASEPETKAVQTELKKHAARIRTFVTMHTAAQMILFPWGFSDANTGICERTDNHDKMNAVADAFANAIENTHNTIWRRGTGCETLYSTTGTSRDYAKAPSPGANIEYSFTPELRGPGFDPPATEIPLSYEEFWNGLKAMVSETEKP